MIILDVYKKYSCKASDFEIEVAVDIEKNCLLSIFGDSGSGKSSIIKMLAGLILPTKGSIIVNDQVWFDRTKGINLPPNKRNIGYVFQDYSLFPNMTVKQNIIYAKAGGSWFNYRSIMKDKNAIVDIVNFLEIEQYEDKYPSSLSGGEQQRVALGRALAAKPDILLLDEPLSALDSRMRDKLQCLIKTTHESFNITTILISHSLSEITRLSDRVLLLRNGRIELDGTPQQLIASKVDNLDMNSFGKIVEIQEFDAKKIIIVKVGSELKSLSVGTDSIDDMKKGDYLVSYS